MTRYFFSLYKHFLYGKRFFIMLLISCLYFSFTMNLDMSGDLWLVVQMQNMFYLTLVFFPLYGILFFPIFFKTNEYSLIRSRMKKRYLLGKLTNFFIFNGLLFSSLYFLLKIIATLFIKENNSSNVGDNIRILQEELSQLFSSYHAAAFLTGVYLFIGFSLLVGGTLIIGEIWGKYIGYLSYLVIFILFIWSNRIGFFTRFTGLALPKVVTYLVLPTGNILESGLSLAHYILIKWFILLGIFLLFFLIYAPLKKRKRLSFFDQLILSKSTVLIIFIFSLFFLVAVYLSTGEVTRFISLYGYGYFYPPKFIFLITYFLFIPFLLSIKISQVEGNINSLITRYKRVEAWQKVCMRTVLKLDFTFFIGILFVLGIFQLTVGNVFSDLFFKQLFLNFLEIIFISLFYLVFYFLAKSSIISFLGCFVSYCLITLPIKGVKYLPFALSSLRVDYFLSLKILGISLLVEVFLLAHFKLSYHFFKRGK